MDKSQVMVLPGTRDGTLRYYYDGMAMRKANLAACRRNVYLVLECSELSFGKCPYKLSIENIPNEDQFADYVETGQHNHPKVPGLFEKYHFKIRFMQEAMVQEPGGTLEELYNDLLSELGYDAAYIEERKVACASVKRRLTASRVAATIPRNPECTIPPRRPPPPPPAKEVPMEVTEAVPLVLAQQYETMSTNERLNCWLDHVTAMEKQARKELALVEAEEARIQEEAATRGLELPDEGDACPVENATQRCQDDVDLPLQAKFCCVCELHPACVMMVSCGHLCLCGLCAMLVQVGDQLCPICGGHGEAVANGEIAFQVAL